MEQGQFQRLSENGETTTLVGLLVGLWILGTGFFLALAVGGPTLAERQNLMDGLGNSTGIRWAQPDRDAEPSVRRLGHQ